MAFSLIDLITWINKAIAIAEANATLCTGSAVTISVVSISASLPRCLQINRCLHH